MKSPKVESTRLQLPVGTTASEPSRAEVGSLGFDLENDKVRVKTSAGWTDLGSGSEETVWSGGLLTRSNKLMSALTTTADGQPACSVGVTQQPANGCYVGVRVNGVDIVAIGDGIKTGADCYFSNDAGATARAWAAITVGDTLHWRASSAGYQLAAASDLIEFNYEAPIDTGTGLLLTPPSIPWRTPPAVANPFSDEFELVAGGSLATAELALRGWQIMYLSTNVLLSYAGPLQPFAAMPAAGTYRASIVNGVLYLQVPSDADIVLLKPTVLPTTPGSYGGFLTARCGHTVPYSPGSNWYVGAAWYNRVSGVVADARSLLSMVYWSNGSAMFASGAWRNGGAGNVNRADVSDTTQGARDVTGIRLIANGGAAVAHYIAMDSNAFRGVQMDSYGGLAGGSISAWTDAGIRMISGHTGGSTWNQPWDFAIDYIRLATGDMTNYLPG